MIESNNDLTKELGNLNNDFNNHNVKLLNQAKESISSIRREFDLYNDIIKNYSKTSKKYEIETVIGEYLEENGNGDIKKDEFFSKLKNQIKDYNEMTANIYTDNHIEKIKELNENLNNILLQLFTPKTGNFTDSSVDILNSSKFYQGFYDDKNEEKEENEDSELIIKCSFCPNNKNIYLCEKCNIFLCSDCTKRHNYSENNENGIHEFKNLSDIKTKTEQSKFLFLKSINHLIELILINSNNLLKKEKIKIIEINRSNNNLKIDYIKRKFEYPYITNYNDADSLTEFLKIITQNTPNPNEESNLNKNINNSFHISEMKKELILSVKQIFEDKKINLYKESMNIIENEFYSDDDFVNECNINKTEAEYDLIKNNFFYVINSIPFKTIPCFDTKKSKEILIKQVKSQLNIQNDNIFISSNNISYFIDNILRTNNFFEYSLDNIRNIYPNLNFLYEIKMIVDNFFSNIFDTRNYLDYKGNFILPNKSLNLFRGSEKYYPPYGWFGIGLKVLGKYENDDWLNKKDRSSSWAIAYHGVGRISTLDEINNMIKDIVCEGLKPGPSQIKCHFNDKRHIGKKIGTGVYLTPSINLAEEYSGIIPFNNKKYNIVIMAKVMINKIKEPEDINYWILNKEYIRPYRILLKEKI
jgi:hypothetical protein